MKKENTETAERGTVSNIPRGDRDFSLYTIAEVMLSRWRGSVPSKNYVYLVSMPAFLPSPSCDSSFHRLFPKHCTIYVYSDIS